MRDYALKSPVRCVVLDFDGTFTDAFAEGAPFVDAYRAELGDLLGRPIDADWARAQAEITAKPDVFGWEIGGRVVAPATVDPYVLTTTIAQLVLAGAGVLRDPSTRSAVLQALYHQAYGATKTVFRPEARDVLEALLARGLPVTVVTNSSTEAVAKKLDALGARGRERVRVLGGAQKFVLADPDGGAALWGDVPEELRLAGLARPILLRRGRYLDSLRATFEAADATAREALVCGDVFELDLALPLALGACVHLVAGPSTPPWELEHLARAGARASAGALADLVPRLDELLRA